MNVTDTRPQSIVRTETATERYARHSRNAVTTIAVLFVIGAVLSVIGVFALMHAASSASVQQQDTTNVNCTLYVPGC